MADGGKAQNSSRNQVTGKGWEVHQVLVPALDALIIGTGLLGHLLVVFILAGRRRKSGSRTLQGTDTLLLALSSSDVLLLLSLPFHTTAIALGSWPFGQFLCKAVSFLGVACNAVSAFILAALAIARYLTVVHPTWVYRSSLRRWLQITAVTLWVPAMALATPQFAFRTVGTFAAVHCFAFLSDVSQVVYSISLFLFSFALPLVVIVLMYAKLYGFLQSTRTQGRAPQVERYQKQVTQTTALLVIVFTISWLPSYALMFSRVGQNFSSTPEFRSLAMFARLLATSSSAINPLLYAFVSQKFRRELLELGWGRCGGRFGVRCGSCEVPHWLAWCPNRSRDMVQPFTPAELNTPPP
ncbi:hypothetical protein P4O66_004071 [Electrophorus voltai]|uniref:G-protein coupled receptors family 1 profile domain-containing protein n=2 Tax=Electrophorus TaxID=8004 RepID=A0A4W4HNN8_ELEEL|nr:hypothetical protein P4O66_004071 [Electrophorus voltai]